MVGSVVEEMERKKIIGSVALVIFKDEYDKKTSWLVRVLGGG